jgi:hypothetical protein
MVDNTPLPSAALCERCPTRHRDAALQVELHAVGQRGCAVPLRTSRRSACCRGMHDGAVRPSTGSQDLMSADCIVPP